MPGYTFTDLSSSLNDLYAALTNWFESGMPGFKTEVLFSVSRSVVPQTVGLPCQYGYVEITLGDSYLVEEISADAEAVTAEPIVARAGRILLEKTHHRSLYESKELQSFEQRLFRRSHDAKSTFKLKYIVYDARSADLFPPIYPVAMKPDEPTQDLRASITDAVINGGGLLSGPALLVNLAELFRAYQSQLRRNNFPNLYAFSLQSNGPRVE